MEQRFANMDGDESFRNVAWNVEGERTTTRDSIAGRLHATPL